MKHDYLWDKSGADAEIESLENALAVFRHRETAPPALPAKVISFKKESPPEFKRFAFAIAACLMLAAISLGAWFWISNDKTEPGADLAIAPPVAEILPNESPFREAKFAPPKVVAPNETLKPKIVKAKRIVQTRIRQNQIVARKPKSEKSSAPSLTKEEKYAYDQLMLALSITSSKLKIVKDKIEGMEE
jgi:hypothetical protein